MFFFSSLIITLILIIIIILIPNPNKNNNDSRNHDYKNSGNFFLTFYALIVLYQLLRCIYLIFSLVSLKVRVSVFY